MSGDSAQRKALAWLVLATMFWALSFPAMKALVLAQQALVPAAGSWFFSSLCVTYRFGVSALVLAVCCARTLRGLSRSELGQGLGLGLFGGAGLLLQVDGLAHTDASTSAFLTQSYCLWLPLWAALRQGRRPPARVLACSALVLAGVAVLARVDWRHLRLGRGEIETLLASVLFTGQILWLERPRYARNRVLHFSAVMFAVMSVMSVPVAMLTAPRAADWVGAYRTPATLGFLGLLIGFSTLGGYLLMNRWQRHVTATEAGLIYCCEPVFASSMALVLPTWFSRWSGIHYGNEQLTLSLLLGGSLITLANVILQSPWPARPRPAPAHAIPASPAPGSPREPSAS
ncbi:MAG: DMT family transporter [Verrucomicrobia bacterium]|nr:DMT family transporter [Verrucomicrobiota bacterium]